MKVKIVAGSLFVIILFILFIFFKNFLKKEYLILLKRDGIIFNLNDQNQLMGEVQVIKKGKVSSVENYINGKKEGWRYTYYSDGSIMEKCYYHLNQADGQEIQYFDNGKVRYQMMFEKGKRIGDWYEYSQEGRLLSYIAYDINGNPFCIFKYDRLGNVTKISPPVSLASYSIDTTTNKKVILTFEEKHKNIRDLYTNIAVPPEMKLDLEIIKDGKICKDFKIFNNVLEIENAFPKKGLNKIYVKIDLTYRNRKLIENLKGDLSIIRE